VHETTDATTKITAGKSLGSVFPAAPFFALKPVQSAAQNVVDGCECDEKRSSLCR
jgi:hypothetical protein